MRYLRSPSIKVAAIAVSVASLLVISGCGGSSSNKEASMAPAQDKEAMTAARNLVTEVETCYTDTQDYSKCGDNEMRAQGSFAKIGDKPGSASVSDNKTGGFTVTANSKSGSIFTLKRESGGQIAYSCKDEADSKGACKDGKWK